MQYRYSSVKALSPGSLSSSAPRPLNFSWTCSMSINAVYTMLPAQIVTSLPLKWVTKANYYSQRTSARLSIKSQRARPGLCVLLSPYVMQIARFYSVPDWDFSAPDELSSHSEVMIIIFIVGAKMVAGRFRSLSGNKHGHLSFCLGIILNRREILNRKYPTPYSFLPSLNIQCG